MVKVKERNSNFELMRIISMMFIILWHIIIHGNMITNCTNETLKFILEIIQYAIIIHVNSFVLLSGYFQSKSNFRLSKFLSLLFQVIFYVLLISILADKFNLIDNYGVKNFVNDILPSTVDNYWFIKMYIVVYLLSDIINKFIDSLDRKTYKNILIVLFLIFSISTFLTGGKFFENNGYNFYHFIFIYMIGGYLRRYPIKETYHLKNMTINGYRCFLVFGFFFAIFVNYSFTQLAYRISNYDSVFNMISNDLLYSHFMYSNPFVIIQTICYFLLFETLNIKSKIINLLSSCTFGTYLFHDNDIVRANIYKFFEIDNGYYSSYNMIIKLFIVLIIIFIMGIIIELIRKILIFILFKFRITKKIVNKIRSFFDSFNFKISW